VLAWLGVRAAVHDDQGQMYRERRARALARAVGAHAAAMELDQMLHDRQTETQAPVPARG
jgi:hypothetical protein